MNTHEILSAHDLAAALYVENSIADYARYPHKSGEIETILFNRHGEVMVLELLTTDIDTGEDDPEKPTYWQIYGSHAAWGEGVGADEGGAPLIIAIEIIRRWGKHGLPL